MRKASRCIIERVSCASVQHWDFSWRCICIARKLWLHVLASLLLSQSVLFRYRASHSFIEISITRFGQGKWIVIQPCFYWRFNQDLARIFCIFGNSLKRSAALHFLACQQLSHVWHLQNGGCRPGRSSPNHQWCPVAHQTRLRPTAVSISARHVLKTSFNGLQTLSWRCERGLSLSCNCCYSQRYKHLSCLTFTSNSRHLACSTGSSLSLDFTTLQLFDR